MSQNERSIFWKQVHQMQLLHGQSQYHWLWCHLLTFYPKKRPHSSFENNTGPTDGRTYGRTDGPTDTPSYRDVSSHLKMFHFFLHEIHLWCMNYPYKTNARWKGRYKRTRLHMATERCETESRRAERENKTYLSFPRNGFISWTEARKKKSYGWGLRKTIKPHGCDPRDKVTEKHKEKKCHFPPMDPLDRWKEKKKQKNTHNQTYGQTILQIQNARKRGRRKICKGQLQM